MFLANAAIDKINPHQRRKKINTIKTEWMIDIIMPIRVIIAWIKTVLQIVIIVGQTATAMMLTTTLKFTPNLLQKSK